MPLQTTEAGVDGAGPEAVATTPFLVCRPCCSPLALPTPSFPAARKYSWYALATCASDEEEKGLAWRLVLGLVEGAVQASTLPFPVEGARAMGLVRRPPLGATKSPQGGGVGEWRPTS